ncbi:MAG: hypothetical protein AAFY42_09510 [Pseudomonadota bacterium]
MLVFAAGFRAVADFGLAGAFASGSGFTFDFCPAFECAFTGGLGRGFAAGFGVGLGVLPARLAGLVADFFAADLRRLRAGLLGGRGVQVITPLPINGATQGSPASASLTSNVP